MESESVRGTRIIGLDVGDRWLGVALSDPSGVLATPFAVIDRAAMAPPGDIEAVARIIRDHEESEVVVGVPLSMDGGFRQQAKKVEGFIDRLSGTAGVTIHVRDERLSTVYAGRLMREPGVGARRAKKKMRDDAAAAAIVLQSYLDERLERSRNDDGERDGIADG